MGTNGDLLVIVGVVLKGKIGPCPDHVSSVLLSWCKVSNPVPPYIQGSHSTFFGDGKAMGSPKPKDLPQNGNVPQICFNLSMSKDVVKECLTCSKV